MRENYMGAEGAKHFADALVVNQSITSLECAHTLNALAFSQLISSTVSSP